jgi:hypothetical protein
MRRPSFDPVMNRMLFTVGNLLSHYEVKAIQLDCDGKISHHELNVLHVLKFKKLSTLVVDQTGNVLMYRVGTSSAELYRIVPEIY